MYIPSESKLGKKGSILPRDSHHSPSEPLEFKEKKYSILLHRLSRRVVQTLVKKQRQSSTARVSKLTVLMYLVLLFVCSMFYQSYQAHDVLFKNVSQLEKEIQSIQQSRFHKNIQYDHMQEVLHMKNMEKIYVLVDHNHFFHQQEKELYQKKDQGSHQADIISTWVTQTLFYFIILYLCVRLLLLIWQTYWAYKNRNILSIEEKELFIEELVDMMS